MLAAFYRRTTQDSVVEAAAVQGQQAAELLPVGSESLAYVRLFLLLYGPLLYGLLLFVCPLVFVY